MFSLRRHALSLLAALLVSAFAPRLYAQTRIAVVNLQRAILETEDGRRASQTLKRLAKRYERDMAKRQAEIKALQEEIEENMNVWSDSVKQQKMQEYQRAAVEYQTKAQEYQRELAEREAELTQEIVARMRNILRRIGEAERYTMIVDRGEGGVIWVPTDIDLTDQLIQRYNAGEGREGGGGSSRERAAEEESGGADADE